MKRLVYQLIFLPALIILSMITLSGCNNDIFIDSPDIPDSMQDIIEGDGGEAEFTIPTKGLERISLDIYSENQKYCHYYNAKGEEISDKSPASEVSRILFETDYCKFEVLRKGKKIVFRSICSAISSEDHETIRLEYSHGVRFIYLVILPGKPLKLMAVNYDTPLSVTDNAQVKTTHTTVNNDGPLPTRVNVMPYAGENASVMVVPESDGPWAGYHRTVTMDVPFYQDGEWGMKEIADLQPGTKAYFLHPDRFMEVPVDIPAQSRVNISEYVTYSKAEAGGSFVFKNEILDVVITVPFKVTSLYPVSYEIKLVDAN